MKQLTEKQEHVLTFIKTFKKSKGYPPTRKEIAQHFGFASNNTAQAHLDALRKKGRIVLKANLSRGIQIA